jgi:hypothetical protein
VSERDHASTTGEAAQGSVRQRIKIVGDLDRKTVEALQLEIRRLARLQGVEITDLRIEPAPADEQDSSA